MQDSCSYLDRIDLKSFAVPVGAGLPAMRPGQAMQDSCSYLDRIDLKSFAVLVGAGLPAMRP